MTKWTKLSRWTKLSPDLRWNNELSRDAQAWAEKIARQNSLQHATPQQRNEDGENLVVFANDK